MGRCPECGRVDGHAGGCPMADLRDSIIGYCALCGEPIYEWEDRYESVRDTHGYEMEYIHCECMQECLKYGG